MSGNLVNMSSEKEPEEGATELQVTKVERAEEKKNGVNGATHDYIDYSPSGWLELTLAKMSQSTGEFMTKNGSSIKVIMLFVLNGVAIGFFFGALYYWINNGQEELELCQGFGSLIAYFTIVYFFIIYFQVIKRFFGKWFERVVWQRVESISSKIWNIQIARWCICIAGVSAVVVFLVWDTQGAPERLISILGLLIILGLGFVFSAAPGRINWRSVVNGLLLQFLFGVLFIRWDTGRMALECFSNKVAAFLSYGQKGAAFTFGEFLVNTEQVFAFSTLPVIFFFSMLVEVLFFWGALQWFCLKLGRVLQAATGTTVCESVIAVGNVFLGMTESILLVKPYLSILTPSELHVVMSSGFATVSGTILVAYIGFGAQASHLVTASVMSAPAAVCLSKLLVPETRRSLTTVDNIQPVESQDSSALSAATRGATNGISLVLNIVANLVAFVSLVELASGALLYCGELVGAPQLTLDWVFGKLFIPLCWLMGVPWEECEQVGSLIGLKTVVNEFVAYKKMGEMKEARMLSPRAELIATYSLCGFTNPSSAAIMIGAMAAVAPNQREVLSSLAVRAFFAGCGICFMTACIAALLMPEGSF